MNYLNDLVKKGAKMLSLAKKNDNEYYYMESIKIFREVLDLKPDFAPIFASIGTAMYGLERYSEAIEEYTKSLDAKENNSNELRSDTLFNRGIAKFTLGKNEVSLDDPEKSLKYHEESLSDYEKSLEYNKHNYNSHLGIGVLKNNMGYYVSAIKHFNQALKSDNEALVESVKSNIRNTSTNMEGMFNILAKDFFNEEEYKN